MSEWHIVVQAIDIVQLGTVSFPIAPGTFQCSLVLSVNDRNGQPITGLMEQNVQLCELGGISLVAARPIVFFLEATVYSPDAMPGCYIFEPNWNDLELGVNSFVFGVSVKDDHGNPRGQTLVRVVRAAPVA